MRLGQSAQAAPGVLHSFASGADGKNPVATLIGMSGVLYGTTCDGGTYHAGTVFAVTTAGSERVLHSFGNGKDGACPSAGPVFAVNAAAPNAWFTTLATGETARVLLTV